MNWYKKAQSDKVLILTRGISGSGKSTLAESLVEDGVMYDTDEYFYDDQGNYNFDVDKLYEAHQWNINRGKEAIQNGISPVVISNMNLKFWHMKPYVEEAVKHGYEIKMVQPNWDKNLYTDEGEWNVDFINGLNVHGVDKDKLQLMADDFEYNPTIEKILQSQMPNFEDLSADVEPM
jgi:hypothetical protein